jgi:aromatic ring-opening dioxygenase catalytic subunit (LigB family)
MSSESQSSPIPRTQSEWRTALESLPQNPAKIPAFFFAHGSPMLAFESEPRGAYGSSIMEYAGPNGPLAAFLKDFGPILLKKFKPKGILVFSAHWETTGERLGISLSYAVTIQLNLVALS